MKYRTLGRTGLRVSELCLGTWSLSGQWGADVEPGIAAIRRAFELGVNFFDTAYAYGEGAAETALARGLGELIATHRDELVIATKGGIRVEQDAAGGWTIERDSSAAYLRTTLEHSLRLLGTDYVDVYFIHWPDRSRPYAEAAVAMNELVQEGLVRHVGLSNFTVAEMQAFREGGPFGVAQVPYNLLWRDVDRAVLPYCERENVGVMGWSALASGLLTGALGRGHRFDAGDWRGRTPSAGEGTDRMDALPGLFQGADEQLNAVIDRLKGEADARGVSLAQLALAWVLSHPSGIIPIVGAQEPAHAEASAAAVDLELTAEEAAQLTAIASGLPSVQLAAEDYEPEQELV
ncbi:MAG TPA: aldo/keto reductase [Conexibacter sp.]|nr:aldo/keto reductase [Conexibacter sp.]